MTKRSGEKRTTKSTSPCERIGAKRSDLRCRTPDGQEWASPLEYEVFAGLTAHGFAGVRRTTPDDAMKYTTPVKGGVLYCGGKPYPIENCQVVQERVYTPDLAIEWIGAEEASREHYMTPIYLEVKGYFAGPKRNLFRAVRQSNPQADIRIIASSNHWVTKGKTRLSDWAKRFKIPFHVWDGKLPEGWL